MHYFDLSAMEGFPFDPDKKIALVVKYDEISDDMNSDFILGIKALVAATYTQ